MSELTDKLLEIQKQIGELCEEFGITFYVRTPEDGVPYEIEFNFWYPSRGNC